MVRELGKYVVVHPIICHGAPTIKGTRVPVELILQALADGMTRDEIASNWSLPGEAVTESIQLARRSFLKEAEEAQPRA